MSDKFKEMASKAREEHEKTIAAAQAKLEAERAARYQSVDTAVLALRTHVQPVIEQARREFHSEGIEMRVEENYDVRNFSSQNPSIIIKCAGPIRPSHRYQPFSRACIFSSDGQRVFVELESHRSERSEKLAESLLERADHLIEEGIKRVLQEYFDALPEMKWIADVRR
jgi:hypothetical protein